jgi:RNA polymerase sigma-70 factor, ECF subfamily
LGSDKENVDGLLQADVLRVIERFALRLTGEKDAAADLVQEACLRAWQHRRGLREGGAVRGWLLTITANLWRDRQRRRSVSGRCLAANEFPDASPAPSLRLITEENVRRALVAMEKLPPAQRDALYLAAVEGLRRSEIAEILGTSVGAVKVNLSIARRKMREQLRDIWDEL